VPPLFTACLIGDAQYEAQVLSGSLEAVTGWRATVHGEHDTYFWGPVRPGMQLRWTAVTHSVRQKSTGVVVVERISVTDSSGARLVEHFWSDFFVGGRVEEDMGPDPVVGPAVPEGDLRPVGSRTIRVDRDQAFRYAGVSGDHAGHAIDDAIARSEGYPSKILQGMCTFSLVSGALVDLLADGDPERLRRLAVRFSAPAFPSREIEVVTFAGPGESGRVFAFEARQAGVTVLSRGQVELNDG
jgi:acyl dehydratase